MIIRRGREMWFIKQQGLIKTQTWKTAHVADSPGRVYTPSALVRFIFMEWLAELFWSPFLCLSVFFSPMCAKSRGQFPGECFFLFPFSWSQISPAVCWKPSQNKSLASFSLYKIALTCICLQISDWDLLPFLCCSVCVGSYNLFIMNRSLHKCTHIFFTSSVLIQACCTGSCGRTPSFLSVQVWSCKVFGVCSYFFFFVFSF